MHSKGMAIFTMFEIPPVTIPTPAKQTVETAAPMNPPPAAAARVATTGAANVVTAPARKPPRTAFPKLFHVESFCKLYLMGLGSNGKDLTLNDDTSPLRPPQISPAPIGAANPPVAMHKAPPATTIAPATIFLACLQTNFTGAVTASLTTSLTPLTTFLAEFTMLLPRPLKNDIRPIETISKVKET